MNTYIRKPEGKQGPFDEATIRAGLESGRFSHTELAWQDGMPEWLPLSTLFPKVDDFTKQSGGQEWKATLVCIAGPDAGKRLELVSNVAVSIGRASDCDFVCQDPHTSGHHALVTLNGNSLSVQSLEGASTAINHVETVKGELSPEQQMRIGWSYWQLQVQSATRMSAGAVFGKVAGKISAAAGVGGIEGLSGGHIFGSVLKKRTDDEIEELFITGTKLTTPPLSEVDTNWPKPWAFFKCIIASVLLTAGFWWGIEQYGNPKLIPGLIFAGSFGIPFSILIFFVEMNVPRNVSLYQVFKFALVGGLSSILLTLFLGKFVPATGVYSWSNAIVTGIVEETAKIATVIRLVTKRRFSWTLNGLLLGAAVGAGFAAFETAGYVLEHDVNVMIWRGLFAPFGHLVWTGLAAAAFWKVKGKKLFQWEMIKDPRFIRVFVFVVALHCLWNAPIGIPFMGEWGLIGKFLIIGIVGWILVLSYIQDGLKQIRAAQAAEKSGLPTMKAADNAS